MIGTGELALKLPYASLKNTTFIIMTHFLSLDVFLYSPITLSFIVSVVESLEVTLNYL